MLRKCPKLKGYWTFIFQRINTIYNTSVPVDPKIGLLGLIPDVPSARYMVGFLIRALFIAYKLIGLHLHRTLHWTSPNQPQNAQWIGAVNAKWEGSAIIPMNTVCKISFLLTYVLKNNEKLYKENELLHKSHNSVKYHHHKGNQTRDVFWYLGLSWKNHRPVLAYWFAYALETIVKLGQK